MPRPGNSSYVDDGVSYCPRCRRSIDSNSCCSLDCDYDPRVGSHPVDELMGRDGDPLLATGTRSMWIALFDNHLAGAKRIEQANLELAKEAIALQRRWLNVEYFAKDRGSHPDAGRILVSFLRGECSHWRHEDSPECELCGDGAPPP